MSIQSFLDPIRLIGPSHDGLCLMNRMDLLDLVTLAVACKIHDIAHWPHCKSLMQVAHWSHCKSLMHVLCSEYIGRCNESQALNVVQTVWRSTSERLRHVPCCVLQV